MQSGKNFWLSEETPGGGGEWVRAVGKFHRILINSFACIARINFPNIVLKFWKYFINDFKIIFYGYATLFWILLLQFCIRAEIYLEDTPES